MTDRHLDELKQINKNLLSLRTFTIANAQLQKHIVIELKKMQKQNRDRLLQSEQNQVEMQRIRLILKKFRKTNFLIKLWRKICQA